MKKELNLLAVLALSVILFAGCGKHEDHQDHADESKTTTATNWQPEMAESHDDHGHDHGDHGHAH